MLPAACGQSTTWPLRREGLWARPGPQQPLHTLDRAGTPGISSVKRRVQGRNVLHRDRGVTQRALQAQNKALTPRGSKSRLVLVLAIHSRRGSSSRYRSGGGTCSSSCGARGALGRAMPLEARSGQRASFQPGVRGSVHAAATRVPSPGGRAAHSKGTQEHGCAQRSRHVTAGT